MRDFRTRKPDTRIRDAIKRGTRRAASCRLKGYPRLEDLRGATWNSARQGN